MKSWRQSAMDAVIPGVVAGAAAAGVAAMRGRNDTGSAIAPVNAPSHVFWGDEAAAVETLTLRHTVPGLLVNSAAGVFWAALFEKLFGEAVERNGLPAALLGGAVVSAAAYVTDYHIVPKRLTPGYEHRVSLRSLLLVYGALAVGMGIGAMVVARQSIGRTT